MYMYIPPNATLSFFFYVESIGVFLPRLQSLADEGEPQAGESSGGGSGGGGGGSPRRPRGLMADRLFGGSVVRPAACCR